MNEKRDEQEKMRTNSDKRNIIGIVIILGFVALTFLINYKNENTSIPSGAKRGIEDLKGRLSEILELENNHEFGKIYDSYYSPETKARLKRDAYINDAEGYFKDKVFLSKIVINDAKIDGDAGYIDRTRVNCSDENCTSKNETRSYKKFVYVDNNWQMVVEEKPITCIRNTGYDMPEEFKRALSLIAQRSIQADTARSRIWGSFVSDAENCLNIQYAKSSDNISDAEGMFVFAPSQSMEKFDIIVSPKYKAKDDLLTAILLIHEIVHVRDFINDQNSGGSTGCFETEANAFSTQNYFASILNQEEMDSINSRVLTRTSDEAQQILYVFSSIPKFKGDNYNEKALNFVKASPAYQEQCKGRE